MMWSSVVVILLAMLGTISTERFRRKDRSRRNILNMISDKCPYACTCPTKTICAECEECPRQMGEPCSDDRPCDHIKSLFCKYLHEGDTEGICKGWIETTGVPCVVYNRTYEHGETFSLDCRTQCACQNGTYACSSLCPQEHISPKGTCRHPRLVEVPRQCCREWMCDSQEAEQPPSCDPVFSKWSDCSADCGAGLSNRKSNLNARCETNIEKRICQTRRCESILPKVYQRNHHHLRRGHECKATHRLSIAVYLRFGPCVSRKRYRPKYCGQCPAPDVVCAPLLSTTVKVDFLCEAPNATESLADLVPEYLEPGEDLWADEHPPRLGIDSTLKLQSVSVQWVLKCRCDTVLTDATSSIGLYGAQGQLILHRVHRTTVP